MFSGLFSLWCHFKWIFGNSQTLLNIWQKLDKCPNGIFDYVNLADAGGTPQPIFLSPYVVKVSTVICDNGS